MRYILFVGFGNTLADLEIHAQINNPQKEGDLSSSFVMDTDEEAIKIVSKLGSAIKLAKEVGGVDSLVEDISSRIYSKTFSITNLNDFNLSAKLNDDVKRDVGQSRFILPKNNYGLSPLIILKEKVTEFLVDSSKSKLYQTIWVHNFEHWIKKDREMPFFNARAGMLPPKIARSMVNLIPGSGVGKTLVDPFCGSGRVLVEAAEMGYKVIGLDIVSDQVEDTKANLRHLNLSGEVHLQDATHLSEIVKDIDAIVTEPFLGKPNLRPDKSEFAAVGLQKLYLGCLKDWYKSLKMGGFIVMVFPILTGVKKDFHTSKIIDSVKKLGYNSLAQTIYSRPDAGIKREIIILQKQN